MEQHVSSITQFVNHYLGGPVLALLSALHITPEHSDRPIPEHVVMALLVLVIATILVAILRTRLSVERPGSFQQVAEMLISNPMGFGVRDLVEENVHHDPLRYVPFIGSIGIFVLLANLMSVIPAFSAPSVQVTVPLACAILTFFYFNYHGLRHHGPVKYTAHFAGPVWWLSPLIFPVEIISTSARVLSLTVRLWANILASDLIYAIFLSLFVGLTTWGWAKNPILGVALCLLPAILPLMFIALHVFVAIVQAYIFTILPSVYLGLATAEEHE